MLTRHKILFFFAALISLTLIVVGAYFYVNVTRRPPQELPVAVTEVLSLGSETWLLPKKALVGKISGSKAALFQVKNLRARKVQVALLEDSETGLKVKNGSLRPGDFVIVNPQGVTENQAVAPVSGMDDQKLIQMVLEAGRVAIEKEDFSESLRFLSPRYQDTWGYNSKLIKAFLKRAYKEFSHPRLEVLDRPVIQVAGNRALVQTAVRLRATYQTRSNYLLGDTKGFNRLLLALEKDPSGWKLVEVKGLKPLDLDEGFLKLIGSEIGLPLTKEEQQERQKACMPCRDRMAERFGK
jgi:hypothetical protein